MFEERIRKALEEVRLTVLCHACEPESYAFRMPLSRDAKRLYNITNLPYEAKSEFNSGYACSIQKTMKRLLSLIVAFAAFSLSSHEQEDVTDDQVNNARLMIEEIVVTATKREEGVYDVPAALSVFVGNTLEERGISDIVDIGKFVPNLNVTTFGAGHSSSVNPFIRGIGLQDHLITTDPGVSVYVDGVYLGRQIGQHLNLQNIERVEVLRGPQGTLYGRNSIGGAINIETARPGSYPKTKVAARIGTRSRLNASLFTDGSLSDHAAVSFTASVQRRGGVGEFLNVPNSSVGVGEISEFSGRLVFVVQPNDAWSVLFAFDANDGTNGLNPYTTLINEVPIGAVYAAGYRNSDVSADIYDNNTGQLNQLETTNSAQGVSITSEWSLSHATELKLIASSRSSTYTAGLDDDSFFDDFLSFPELGEADQDSLEIQLNTKLGGFEFVAGLLEYRESGENLQDPTVFLGFRGRFELSQDVNSRAIFTNLGREITDRLRLSAGLRYTKDEKDAATNVGTGLVRASRSWSETSWDLTARFDVNDQLSTYGTLQSGYQSGQFPARPYCLFGDSTCFVASDNITALNHELGVKGQPRLNLEISAAVFLTRYMDLPIQVNETTDDGFATANLIVEQTTSGFEWESRWLVTPSFTLQSSVGTVNIDIDRVANVQPVAALTPELTVSIGPEIRREMQRGQLIFRMDYSWRDEMFGEPSSDLGRYTKIDGRRIVNFNASYQSLDEHWQVSVYGRNVFDERYDNARLNTGDYLLRILSNDASEFGVWFEVEF